MLRSILIATGVVALLVGFERFARGASHARALWRGAAVVTLAACLLQVAGVVRHNVAEPPEWDFLALWTSAHVAAEGRDFYDPASYREIAAAIPRSQEFKHEILDVGFWYPPPAMLLYRWVGGLDPRVALAAWYVIQLAALGGACLVLARTFLPGYEPLDAVLMASALVLLLHGARATFVFAQTNALVLLLLALAFHDRDKASSGAWLGLAAVIKPWVAVTGLALVLERRWRAVAAAVGAHAAAWALALAVFGAAPLRTYLTNPPTSRVPALMFVERINQSLLAVVLRAEGFAPGSAGPPRFPFVYVAIMLALLAVTCVLIVRLRRSGDLALAFAIALALVVYPGSLRHYTAFTVVCALVIWSHRRLLPPAPWLGAAAIGAGYALADLEGGYRSFEAFVYWWLVLAALAWLEGRRGDLALSSPDS